jgi:hypothetical protein
MLYVLVFGGIALLCVVLFYFIIWSNKRKTVKVRNKILNGEKRCLVQWRLDEHVNFAGFQKSNGAFRGYKKHLNKVKEIYLCDDGILLDSVLFYSWDRFTKELYLGIQEGNPTCLRVRILYEVGDSSNLVDFLVPITPGKEYEVQDVLDHLYEKE